MSLLAEARRMVPDSCRLVQFVYSVDFGVHDPYKH